MLSQYCVTTAICLYPAARLLHGQGSFTSATKLTFLYYFSVWLLGSTWVIGAVLVLVDLLRLTRFVLFAAWTALVLIPLLIITIRCFFAAFSEYFAISKKRLTLALIGGAMLSSVASPVVFVPLLYRILRFEPLWKVIL